MNSKISPYPNIVAIAATALAHTLLKDVHLVPKNIMNVMLVPGIIFVTSRITADEID
jgi:hypothetical protein